jgi:fructosamine-3-kinase
VTHPLLDPAVLAAVGAAASAHRGRPWTATGFTDRGDRGSHPCGVFAGTPFGVFAKLDPGPAGHERLSAELRGLRLIGARSAARVPAAVAGGVIVTSAGALLLTEALPERPGPRTETDHAAIGRALATLHQARGGAFGLDRDGFFGSLPQANQPAASGRWADFYAERRLAPMLALAARSGHLPASLARGAGRVAARLELLAGPEPAPSLLHGDAQQNNFVSVDGGAVLIDPAAYYGHPEADLALAGYFEPAGEAARLRGYQQAAPLDPGFAGRRELWRLHAYLAVIAVAGGAAAGQAFLPRLDAALRRYA